MLATLLYLAVGALALAALGVGIVAALGGAVCAALAGPDSAPIALPARPNAIVTALLGFLIFIVAADYLCRLMGAS